MINIEYGHWLYLSRMHFLYYNYEKGEKNLQCHVFALLCKEFKYGKLKPFILSLIDSSEWMNHGIEQSKGNSLKINIDWRNQINAFVSFSIYFISRNVALKCFNRVNELPYKQWWPLIENFYETKFILTLGT